MAKEVHSIERAIGDKLGSLIMAVGFCVAGLGIAFTKGWLYTFVLAALLPIIAVAALILMKVTQAGFTDNMKAYA
jgi:hypothetical protein